MVPATGLTGFKWMDKSFLTYFMIETEGSTNQGSAHNGMYALMYPMIFNLISVK
jgi:hypothetical protein